MTPRTRTFIQAVVSITLLALIVSRFDFADMWRVITNAELRYVLVAAIATPIIFALKTIKWYLLAKQAMQLSIKQAALSLLAGMGVGLVTPGRVGELTRVMYIENADRSRLLGVVAIDRLFDLLALLIAGAVAVGFAVDQRVGIMLLIPSIGLLSLFFVPRLPAMTVDRIADIRWLPKREMLKRVAAGLMQLNGRVLVLTFALSVASFVLGAVQFYILLRSFVALPPIAAAVSFPILTLAGVIPITIGGFGTREGASVIVLAAYGIAEFIAVNATLLSFILNTLIPGILGLIIAPAINRSTHQVEPPPNSEVQNDQPSAPLL